MNLLINKNILSIIVALFIGSTVFEMSISYNDWYPYKVLLLTLFLYILVYFIYTKRYKLIFSLINKNSKYIFIFYLMLFWYLLSYLWIGVEHDNFINSYFYVIKGIIIVFVIFYFSKSKYNIYLICKTLAIFYSIEIILALLQIYTNISYPISHVNPRSSIPTGFFWNQNDFGALLLMLFPFVLFLKNRFLKIVIGIIFFNIVIYIASATAFVGFISILFLYTIFIKKRVLIFILSILVIIGLFSQGLIEDYIPNNMYNKIINIDKYLNYFSSSKNAKIGSSAKHKLEVKKVLMAELKNNYLLGSGLGQSFYVLKNGSNNRFIGRNYSVHNFWIQMLAEAGVVFFSIFVLWFLFLLKKMYTIYKYAQDKNIQSLSGATLLSLLGFIIASNAPSSIYHMFPMWVLFGFALSLVNVCKLDKTILGENH